MIKAASRIGRLGYSVAVLLAVMPMAGQTADQKPVAIQIRNHVFYPKDIVIPPKTRVRIEVQNLNTTPSEFESSDMRVEKIVVPGGKISLFIGPLQPGVYRFFDDYNPATIGTVHVSAH
jgi:hypothetical protein